MITGPDALAQLKAGNRRFVASAVDMSPTLAQTRRATLARGQSPFAIILGCSDSRVPAELVFGQGFGDLFVIRVAGNIVAPSQIGSVEFAAARFDTRLVVVLGHTQCGAILATVDELVHRTPQPTPGLRHIVELVKPSVEPLLRPDENLDRDTLVARAVRANISASADQLRRGSPLLEGLIAREGLLVVGAEYHLETGVVDFFDGAPPDD